MGVNGDSMKKRRNARNSAQTGKSAKSLYKSLDKKTPFRRGSIREKAFFFLKKKRSYKEFVRFVERRGGDAVHLLRYLRMIGVIEEEKGKMWAR
jgi:hypothetical protein